MSIYDRLPSGPEIDPATNEAIIRNAREIPTTLIYADNDGNTAHGNSEEGYRYYDSNGTPMPREIAEPFRLAGVDIVINNGSLGTNRPVE